MRKFLNLLFGSAAVVGVETTFGLSSWRGWEPESPVSTIKVPLRDFTYRGPYSILPGGITYVSDFRELQHLKNGIMVTVL